MFLLEVGKTFPLQFLDKRSVELKIGLKKKKKKPKKPNKKKLAKQTKKTARRGRMSGKIPNPLGEQELIISPS